LVNFVKNKIRKLKIKIFLIGGFLTIPLFLDRVFAQVPPPQPQDAVPIDGLSFLAIIGILYGVKKLWQKKK